jgi:hypothetical protein
MLVIAFCISSSRFGLDVFEVGRHRAQRKLQIERVISTRIRRRAPLLAAKSIRDYLSLEFGAREYGDFCVLTPQ